MALNNWCQIYCHYLWSFIRQWKFKTFTFIPCSDPKHRTTKGIIWSYFLLVASVITLTVSDLLQSSRRPSIFNGVITLREKQSPTSFWQEAKIASANLKRFISTNCQLGRSSSTASALLKMNKESWRTGGCCQTTSMFCTVQMDFYVV
jgi:hypothetical protein